MLLEVKCPNEACKEQIGADRVDEHLAECNFLMILCKWGCGSKFLAGNAKEKSSHETKCRLLPVKCEYSCGHAAPAAELESHKEQCELRPGL